MKDIFNIAYASDLLIFGIDSRTNDNCRLLPNKYISVLLVKRKKDPFKNSWCLPGRFVNISETSKAAAIRILKKETNLTNVYIEQINTFDNINRDPRGRVISTAYIALIDKNKIDKNLSKNTCWFDIKITENETNNIIMLKNKGEEMRIVIEKKLKSITTNEYEYSLKENENLGFDHGLIINIGLKELINKVNNTDIIFNLMPKEFTIGELKQVYELLLGKKLINSAFRRVIASKIISTNKSIKKGGFRPSTLYKYKKEK